MRIKIAITALAIPAVILTVAASYGPDRVIQWGHDWSKGWSQAGQKRTDTPAGCVGRIVSRKYQPKSHSFKISYFTNNGCTKISSNSISFDQDLKAKCTQGNYYPQCLHWYETKSSK